MNTKVRSRHLLLDNDDGIDTNAGEWGDSHWSVTQTFDVLSYRLPWGLFFPPLVLVILGSTLVFSASPVVSGQSDAAVLGSIIGRLAVAFCGYVWVRHISLQRLRGWAPWLLLLSIVLLLAVLMPGVGVMRGGARRWLMLGGVGFQPSEFAKFATVIALTSMLAKREHLNSEAGLLVPAVLAHMPIACILVSDLGTALVLEASVLSLFFIAGLRWRTLWVMVLAAIPVGYHALVSRSFRRRRILAFLDPWAYRFDEGYQITESLIAFGSGGWTGLGLGRGTHAMFYLPEAHTDFIFAVLGQELGLLGVVFVLSMVAWFMIALTRLGLRVDAAWSRHVILGLSILLVFPMIFHMCVNLGLLPVKGLPFTFMSFGGSNLLVAGFALAVIHRCAYENAHAHAHAHAHAKQSLDGGG